MMSELPSFLNDLNQPQREAVTASLGNTLVLAGAGSGKTKVLVSRIAYLISHYHLMPQSILAVTFTNKAATEMKNRLGRILPVSLHGMWVGTFHSLCHRLLRRHYQEARLPEHFHILDSDDQARLIKRVLTGLHLDETQWPVKQAQHFINQKKDEGLRSGHVQAASYGPTRTWLQVYQAYEQACAAAGVIDFAELLLRTHEVLRDNAELLAHYQHRFQAILVDEFQDTNTIQYAWIRLLASPSCSVMAVGDDDQSIYSWRGAKIANIKHFSHDFSTTKIIRLEQNYRSTARIVEAASHLIDHNAERMGKRLWTAGEAGEKIVVYSAFNELDEARFITERIQLAMDRGSPAQDIAILYRSNAQSRVIEEALLRAGIAYRIYGGVRFFERAEVKDALAYMRLIANINDDGAFERIVNFPTRGIGEKTIDELRTVAKNGGMSLWQAGQRLLRDNQLPGRAATALVKFIHLIEEIREETALLSLDEQLAHTINKSGLYAHFSKLKGDKTESRLDNLQELINAAKQFRYEQMEESMPILVAFLAHASLEAGEMEAAPHDDYVHLMTLHAAKGLEFPIVFIAGVEEGLFPSKQSVGEPDRIEEERRLCYVGMTRAMRQLTMTYAEVRRQYGREEYHRPSRFLRELPPDYLEEIRVMARYQAPTNFQTVAATESGFSLGQRVKQAKFGEGILLDVEGSGAHTRVRVRFDEHGEKWLVLAYANLQPL